MAKKIFKIDFITKKTNTALLTGIKNINLNSNCILEFGCYSGKSMEYIQRCINDIFQKEKFSIYGFDTFSGLPEDWIVDGKVVLNKGVFNMDGNVPNIPNVLFYKGLFKDTIPMFKQEKLNDKDIRIGLIHIDCDLYSSTCDILDELIDYIVPGVIIVSDEWNVRVKKEKQNILHQGGEQIAFLEWSKKYNKNYTTIEDEYSYPDPQRYIIKIGE